MASYGSDFRHITIPSTGQLLTRIAPSVWQGNADIYPVDSRITSPGDERRAGHYWSQFLMAGTDPSNGQYFLTDMVESEGETLQAFNVIQSSGKVIEYQGTWTFRNLFTTTAHHWVWVEGNDQYHRVQVSLDVLNPINDVKSIWTELFNATDAYGTVTASTRDDGLQTRSTLGTTNQHHLGQYELGRDDWLAFTNPQDEQAGSVARVLLSSTSDIRADDEVTPIWADYSLFDNIELQVHRTAGTNLAAGTSFFMDNLLITNPATDSTAWVGSKIDRAKEWIGLIGPAIAPPAIDPGDPQSRFFIPQGGNDNWSAATNWSPSPLPDANDTAIIHAGRIATINSNVGAAGTLRIGDLGTGTLNLHPGASLELMDRALIGAGGGSNTGVVNQSGGELTIAGSDPVMFLAFDEDDTANFAISAGKLQAGNLWFRFGKGTLTQSGGLVEVAQLILGEGGNSASQARYDLHGGALTVSGSANIGKAPGAGDPIANSHGKMTITGGVAMLGDLLFGNDATDVIELAENGVVRVRQANYSLAEASNDVTLGNFVGEQLFVSSIAIAGTMYTQITPFVALSGDFNHNGQVDAADYSVWRNTLGSTSDLRADGDGNFVVDQQDYLLWKSNFGASGTASSTFTVPEPASIVLLSFIGSFIFHCRIRIRPRG